MKLAGLFSSPAASTASSSLLGKLFRQALGVALSLATVVWIGHDPSFGRERLHELVRAYLDRLPLS